MKNKYIKRSILVLLALLILAVAYTLYAKKYDKWPFLTSSTRQPISPSDPNTSAPSGSIIDKDEEIQTGSDPSPAPVPSDDGGKSTVGIIISAANKTSSSLQVRAVIQSVTASGQCTLRLSKNGSSIIRTYTADVQAQSSTSTCKGFDVPLADLSSGTWTISLLFENDTTRGEASKEVEI